MIKRNIANFLTILNLLSGLSALFFLFEYQRLDWAIYAIFAGIFWDYVDGFVARLTGSSSELGLQLDTLADMVTSGVVPGFLMFEMLKSFVFENKILAFGLAMIIPVSTAIRLAKFNIDSRQKYGFVGLPAPANALMVASVVWVLFFEKGHFLFSLYAKPAFLIAFVLFSGLILNAPLRLIALKFQNFSWQENKYKYFFILISGILLMTGGFGIFGLIILLYLGFSLFVEYKNQQG